MTSSWSAIPLAVSALAAGFACLGSLILADGWYGISSNDLPGALRAAHAFLSVYSQPPRRSTAEEQPRLARGVGVVIALIFVGGLIAICLSIPLRFLVDPEWVRANGVNGQISGLVCLCGFVAWLLYLARVYRRAALVASGSTEAKPSAPRPPRSSLRIRFSSPLSADECVAVLRVELEALLHRDPAEEWGRAAELGPVERGSIRVTMSSSNPKLPREQQMPRRTRTWLVIKGAAQGCEVDAFLAARPEASVLGGWLLAAVTVALLATGLFISPVQAASLVAGGIALALLVESIVLFRIGRQRNVSDCRLLLSTILRVLNADMVGATDRSVPRWMPLISGYSFLSDVTAKDLSDLVAADRT